MQVDAVVAGDVALLATTSALLHYALGLYGMLAAYVVLGFVENGGTLWYALCTCGSHCWRALSMRQRQRHDGDNAVHKDALRRQKTWRIDGSSRYATRDERTRSEAYTEPDDNDDDDNNETNTVNDQLLATTDRSGTHNDASKRASPTERLVQRLLAKLSIRDVASPSAASSDTAPPSSTTSTTSSSSSTASSSAGRLVTINARAPVPFETDLFVGHALFLVRTSPEDPVYAHLFAGKRRTFWIQVQGRFKRRPRGVVYLGGELPGRVSLGLFTKSMALVIVGIIQSLVGKVYVSFGRALRRRSSSRPPPLAVEEMEERPTVSFPLYQSVDQFMVTPAGETPPPLGRADFGESDQARARRRQTPLGRGGDLVFDVGPTYSFHFHTMYVNLAHWKTANLPGLSDMHLTTFFDALPLRLVAYDVAVPPTANSAHRQAHKQYLFNFEVAFDPTASHPIHEKEPTTTATMATIDRRLWRSDSEQSFASSSESTGTAPSVGSSPSVTVLATSTTAIASAAADQAAIVDALATIDDENARALQSVRLEYLFWIEEVDAEMGVRRVQYVFRLRERTDDAHEHEDDEEQEDDEEEIETERIVVVSAYRLRLLLGTRFRKLRRLYTLQGLRFHARARIDSYSIIDDEARDVAMCLQRLLSLARHEDDAFHEDNEALVRAFESALYQILTARTHLQLPHDGATLSTELTPASIGVKTGKHRRSRDNDAVTCEGVVYRFYADTVMRQEVLVLTPDALEFYRSQSSSPDKMVAYDRIIGVQAAPVPYTTESSAMTLSTTTPFAFALQINTFAEEMVVCVATEHARDAWIRVVLQHCCPRTNVERALTHEPLAVCYTPTKCLKPANRIELNARVRFPRPTAATNDHVDDHVDDQDALDMVATALRSALRVHALGDRADVPTILEFLNHASALRSVDLARVLARPHEDRLTFFLNLYHVVLAHAMMAHGFPRATAQWAHFQTHMCYVVGRDAHHTAQPLSFSLAEIEHVILRARLPPAELPHLKLGRLSSVSASRVAPFRMAHPDFRVSFALLMNQNLGRHVPIFTAATIHEQLNAVVQQYVAQHVTIDHSRKTIFLPRLCEWIKHDFGGGGSPLYCVRKLLGFMDDRLQQDALEILDSDTLVHIKYGVFHYTARTTLRLAPETQSLVDDDDEQEDDEVDPGDSP